VILSVTAGGEIRRAEEEHVISGAAGEIVARRRHKWITFVAQNGPARRWTVVVPEVRVEDKMQVRQRRDVVRRSPQGGSSRSRC